MYKRQTPPSPRAPPETPIDVDARAPRRGRRPRVDDDLRLALALSRGERPGGGAPFGGGEAPRPERYAPFGGDAELRRALAESRRRRREAEELERARARSRATEARAVVDETEDAYAASLREDQAKDRRRREAAAAQAAVDAAKAAEKQKEEALVERRAAAKARVDSTEEAAGPAAKRVRVRLPAGPPLARAFREGDAISVVRDFVDASGRAPRNFALVYAGPPKRTLGDDDAPLSSLGPGPVALMVADLDA